MTSLGCVLCVDTCDAERTDAFWRIDACEELTAEGDFVSLGCDVARFKSLACVENGFVSLDVTCFKSFGCDETSFVSLGCDVTCFVSLDCEAAVLKSLGWDETAFESLCCDVAGLAS